MDPAHAGRYQEYFANQGKGTRPVENDFGILGGRFKCMRRVSNPYIRGFAQLIEHGKLRYIWVGQDENRSFFHGCDPAGAPKFPASVVRRALDFNGRTLPTASISIP